MFIRQLEYLVTLAKEKHFARAADSCCVSQPALSTAIRNLEEELGVTIIRRGRRYQGVTPEGEQILDWARKTLSDWKGLRNEVSSAKKQISGILRIGAIPTAMHVISLLTGSYLASHIRIRQQVLCLSTEEILCKLNDFEIDLGFTYLDDQPLEGMQSLPLYRERFMLLARNSSSLDNRTEISWREASDLPLCLLPQDMQNRRAIDAAFQDANVFPRVLVETNSPFALYTHVRSAGMYSIVPHSLLSVFGMLDGVTAIPLTPTIERVVGLVSLDRKPQSPMVSVAWEVAEALDLEMSFSSCLIARSY